VDLASGTEFAGYRIERTLGRGGMGVVYLAEHERLKRRVALKVLAPELADDERFRERFIRESELAASLDQPNVLPVYDAGEQEGHLFIAMRYVDGADLRELIDESPLALDDVLTVVADVARALDAAHSKGLVHRDVKPGNILIARSSGSRAIEHVYLTDFGLTKRSTSRSGLTGTGVFVGTLEYAAPEQFEGKPLGPHTDVYSLGCVLFECLTGEPPFRREQDAALMYAHLHDPPPSATARRPELPRGVDRVIEKAMAKRPVDRYATAGELAAALKGVTAGDRLPRPGRTHSQRKTWLAAAVAVIAVGVALTFVAFARGGGDPGSGGPSATAAASALPAGSLARIDPETGDASLPIPGVQGLGRDDDIQPNLAIGEGGVWISVWPDGDNPLLQHFDEATGEIRAQHQMKLSSGSAFPGFGLAVGSRTVWFSGADDGSRVSRINPATDEPLPPVSIDSGIVTDIVLGGERLWVGSGDGTLTAFDPLTGRRLDELEIDGTPDALAYGDGSVWALDLLEGEVIRVDPVKGRVLARISVAGNPGDIAAGDGGVWVMDPVAGTAAQIDPLTDAPGSSIGLGPAPSGIAVGLGSAWVSDGEDGILYRIDPELARATPIPLGAPLAVVAIDDAGRSVWVGAFAED
jgi:tRNA A-37 threonylcarbamoyl transferase component Bud32/outer membrane protein assembly factor BamB